MPTMRLFCRQNSSINGCYVNSQPRALVYGLKMPFLWTSKSTYCTKQLSIICVILFSTTRKFLPHKNCEILIHTYATSWIDYCNSLLSGLPHHLLQIGPKYLTDTLIKYMPSSNLLSANTELLVIPKYNIEIYGKRPFCINKKALRLSQG